MTKEEVLRTLRALPFAPEDYWLITGGAMVLYGFRPETGDVDLGCTAALADRLEAEGCLQGRAPDGMRHFHLGERIELFENWMADAVTEYEGVPVVTVEGLLAMKEKLGREKDRADVERIRARLRGKERGEA